MVSHQYVFFCVCLGYLEKMTWDTDHKKNVSHQYVFFCVGAQKV